MHEAQIPLRYRGFGEYYVQHFEGCGAVATGSKMVGPPSELVELDQEELVGHEDPITAVVAALAIILAAAKLAGQLCVRLGQPAVLGELLVGVVLGNLHLLGVPTPIHTESLSSLDVLSGLGAIILLFEVGLASTIKEIVKVGLPSLLVAVSGVAAPFFLGWGVSALLLPGKSQYVHAFLGATLTATSVGITARVLKDLGRSRSREAQIIVSAAVIDDVLGLIVLAVISGLIATTTTDSAASYGALFFVVAKAVAFILGALAFGAYLSPRLLRVISRIAGQDVSLVTALVFCFTLAYAASVSGLAAIVGAYAAGLILEDAHFGDVANDAARPLETLIQPIAGFLTPVFFVVMGMHVRVNDFAQPEAVGLAALITVVAIVGKLLSALPVAGRKLDALSIGIAMVPRGEVGLIFANTGLGLLVDGQRVVDEKVFSAIVLMVVLTTMLAPPALKWSLARSARRHPR